MAVSVPAPVQSPPWMADAACAGTNTELFFPGFHDLATSNAAKRVCAGCPVRAECLDHAIVNGETRGIWGGTSERERRVIRRRKPITHATEAGYRLHMLRGEEPCLPCREAHRGYHNAKLARLRAAK